MKDTGQCAIAAPKVLHPRIKKAVLKEKYNDVGYKLLLSENGQHARIETRVDGSMLVFKLNKTVGLDQL